MPTHILTALIYFTLALIFYSVGVLCERYTKELKTWYLLFFWFGLISDTLGTNYVMKLVGGLTFNFHTITGSLGLLLMCIHTIWATYVIITKNEKQIRTFHKFSFTRLVNMVNSIFYRPIHGNNEIKQSLIQI